MQQLEFSVGYPVTEAVRDSIRLVPTWVWQSANKGDGGQREHADVIEVTPVRPVPLDEDLARHAGDRALGAPAPRRDPGRLRDPRRLPVSGITTNTPRGQLAFLPSAAPAALPGRGPDPDREGHLPSRQTAIN